ncbi:hypothetical protein MKW92_020729 [Papaver armeniacum]|nr:hypothetical protein MKW92_020729 [Papaver armeniacum]
MEGETVGKMKLGSQGFEVSKQGLGCMGMSASYGPAKPDSDMIALIHHAIDKGITFLDTSDIYGPYTNEVLIGKAIVDKRDKVELATKFGATFENGSLQIYGNPEYVRAACEASLKRLQVDSIDLYYQHRTDTKVPIEITVRFLFTYLLLWGNLRNLWKRKIKYIGLSEASASTIRRAHAVHPITAVQLEWSLWSRDIEEDIVPTCRELGIGIVAYSPLGRGFLSSGAKLVDNLADNDYRKVFGFKERVHPSQLALAWLHHQGDFVCPIPGTTKIENLTQNISALSVKLTASELAELESLASADAVKGDRYARAHAWTWKNSDTPELSSS